MAVSLDERGPESRGTSYFHSRSVSAIDSLSSRIRTAPLHALADTPGAAHICVARVWLRLQPTEYLPGRNARFARTGSVVRLMPARASNPACGADAQARLCATHGFRRDRRCFTGNDATAVGGTHRAIVRQVPENHATVTPRGRIRRQRPRPASCRPRGRRRLTLRQFRLGQRVKGKDHRIESRTLAMASSTGTAATAPDSISARRWVASSAHSASSAGSVERLASRRSARRTRSSGARRSACDSMSMREEVIYMLPINRTASIIRVTFDAALTPCRPAIIGGYLPPPRHVRPTRLPPDRRPARDCLLS